jgi:hypothetical protein
MNRFNAVSNLAYGGYPVDARHRPDEQSFPTQAEAAAWLKGLRCGGSVSTWDPAVRDFRVVEEVPAG